MVSLLLNFSVFIQLDSAIVLDKLNKHIRDIYSEAYSILLSSFFFKSNRKLKRKAITVIKCLLIIFLLIKAFPSSSLLYIRKLLGLQKVGIQVLKLFQEVPIAFELASIFGCSIRATIIRRETTV